MKLQIDDKNKTINQVLKEENIKNHDSFKILMYMYLCFILKPVPPQQTV